MRVLLAFGLVLVFQIELALAQPVSTQPSGEESVVPSPPARVDSKAVRGTRSTNGVVRPERPKPFKGVEPDDVPPGWVPVTSSTVVSFDVERTPPEMAVLLEEAVSRQNYYMAEIQVQGAGTYVFISKVPFDLGEKAKRIKPRKPSSKPLLSDWAESRNVDPAVAHRHVRDQRQLINKAIEQARRGYCCASFVVFPSGTLSCAYSVFPELPD